MSKKLSLIVLGSILLLAQGCIFFPAVKGDGNVTTHTIDISDYDQISVDASAAVFNYTQEESAPALTVTVDQNIYDLFDFKTDDNKLVIRPKQENKTLRLRPTQFTITSNSRQLKKVDLAGAEKFNVNSKLFSNDKIKFNLAGSVMLHMKDTVTVNQLEVSIAGSGIVDALTLYANEFKGEIAGSGTFNLAGTGEKAAFEIAGSGKIHALNFLLSDVSCEIAGNGLLETHATNNIYAEIAGSGNIRYKGDPSIKMEKAGIGSVKKVD